jgi:inorganic pyrophosphatase
LFLIASGFLKAPPLDTTKPDFTYLWGQISFILPAAIMRRIIPLFSSHPKLSGVSCPGCRLLPACGLPAWFSPPAWAGWLVLVSLLAACTTDYQHLPTFSENQQLQAVILTPAGSTHPQEYDAQQKTFKPAMEAGLSKQFRFLPLPGNLGFIPSTAHPQGDALEGKPLQILVLAESVPTGTVQEVIPISTLLLDMEGELQAFVIAVPARPSEQVIAATDWASFQQQYPAAKIILQHWFLHFQPEKKIRLSGWKDEKYTDTFIRTWIR